MDPLIHLWSFWSFGVVPELKTFDPFVFMPKPLSAPAGRMGECVGFCKIFSNPPKKYCLTVLGSKNILAVPFWCVFFVSRVFVLRSFLLKLTNSLDHHLPASGSDRGVCQFL